MPNIRVVDLSHWNTIPSSLQPAADSGVRGVIHKVTEGSGGRDDKLASRATLAYQAGMLFGGYHFLRPGDMRAQANLFLDTLWAVTDPYFSRRELVYAADHEDKGVSLASLKEFLAHVESRTGNKPVIYSGNVLKEQLPSGGDPVISAYPLWLAHYSNAPILPPGFTKYWLWQWTDSKGTVPGINSPVDCNDYQGTDDQLRSEWTGSTDWVEPGDPNAPEHPPTEPVSPPEPLTITVTVPRGTKVFVEEI